MDLDMAELHVHNRGVTSWIMLIFGEAGWDVIADYSEDLEALIDPIVSPHLPWNKPNADPCDRGYSVLVLPSPADLKNGDSCSIRLRARLLTDPEALAEQAERFRELHSKMSRRGSE